MAWTNTIHIYTKNPMAQYFMLARELVTERIQNVEIIIGKE